jgi:hypothetical protein
MDSAARADLGELVGSLALLLVAGGLIWFLRPVSRSGRLARVLIWFGAGATGGWVGSALDVAVGGTHRVYAIRGTGGWRDMYLPTGPDPWYALAVGLAAALAAALLPRAASRAGRTRQPPSRRARRPRRTDA